jgi:uncharacterized protein YheU (UPF0270 family)
MRNTLQEQIQTLQISNKYGEVVIIDSWDQNRVVIDVRVTVELPNQGQGPETA